MSIEMELAANTAAIKSQTEAINSLINVWSQLTAQATDISAKVATGETTAVTLAGKARIEVAQDKGKTEPTAPVQEAPPPRGWTHEQAAQEQPKVELKDLSAAVTAAATRNREGLVALLAKHNVKRASELPQENWAALLVELAAL